MAHRSHPEILCSVRHRASDIAAPFLHRPFRFHASGTQRAYSTTNIGVMPLTLAPKSDSDFWRECALTHSKAFGKNTQPAPERCRSERVWDFPTSILQRKICICAHECTACRYNVIDEIKKLFHHRRLYGCAGSRNIVTLKYKLGLKVAKLLAWFPFRNY